MSERKFGVVTRWVDGRGFGFIRTDGGEEFFTHFTNVTLQRQLERGDRVSFVVGLHTKTRREEAKDVTIENEPAAMPEFLSR